MKVEKNLLIANTLTQDFLADLYLPESNEPRPLIIFLHGYKGLKDWGPWHLVAEAFATAGFCFAKINFSHNGTTLDNPLEFNDLDSFAKNNYSKELSDVRTAIDFFKKRKEVSGIALIGHSRGGGIAILSAAQNEEVKAVASWAGLADLTVLFPRGEKLNQWRKSGFYEVYNSRTKQQMPHSFTWFTDWQKNKRQLDVADAAKKLSIPYLNVHAADDESVDINVQGVLAELQPNAELHTLADGGHTFGGEHPWKPKELPTQLEEATKATIEFFEKCFSETL